MASRTIPAHIFSLLCVFAILLVALPCASIAHPPASMAMAQCYTCCPAQFAATAPCCDANPQPATLIPQRLAQGAAVELRVLPVTRQVLPGSAILFLASTRNISSPPLHTILRI